MADKKPPTQRLGTLNTGMGANGEGGRRGGLNDDGAGPSTSKPAAPKSGGSSILTKFKPKNFKKIEAVPLPEPKTAAEQPESSSNPRRNRRGGGRHPPPRRPASNPNHQTEAVFGGVLGAGGVIVPEGGGPSRQRNARPKTEPESTTHIKRAPKKKEIEIDSTSDSEDSDTQSESADEDYNEYMPTLLAAKGAVAPEVVPEELMARRPEDVSALHDELKGLSDPNPEEPGLMLFQLPSVLPIPVATQQPIKEEGAGPSTSAVPTAAAATAADGRPAALGELPAAKIGKLVVLRNGSIKMQIGEVLFDVSPGIPCHMRQDFAAVDPVTKNIIMLGDIRKRVVVTPDLDSLLSGEPLPEWKYAAEGARTATAPGRGRARMVLADDDSDDDVGVGANGKKGGNGAANGNAEVKEEDVDMVNAVGVANGGAKSPRGKSGKR